LLEKMKALSQKNQMAESVQTEPQPADAMHESINQGELHA
jgi:hypothetical protein